MTDSKESRRVSNPLPKTHAVDDSLAAAGSSREDSASSRENLAVGRSAAQDAASRPSRGGGARATTERLLAAALFFGTLAVFSPAVLGGFVDFDDNAYVTANPRVQQGLTVENIVWAFSPSTTVASNWHPLTLLSHMLDCQLFGLWAPGHHATSLLLHALNATILFWFLTRTTAAVWPSVWVATLFAVHPLRVESVAWVAERKDVLSTLFWFLALVVYAGYARRPTWRRMAWVAGWFVLGLMSKPMLVTVPVVLLLLDFWPLARLGPGDGDLSHGAWRGLARRLWPRVVEKLPLFLLAVIFSGVTLLAQRAHGVRSLDQLPALLRLTNAMASYGVYLWQTVWPVGLAAFYPHPANAEDLSHFAVAAAGLLVVVGGSVFVWRAFPRRPYLAVGWFWYLITLLPVIGLVQVGGQAHADRYTYVPQVGLFMMIAWTAADEVRSRPSLKPLFAGVGVLWPLVLIPVTWQQIGTWRNAETLFRHAAAVTKRNFLAERALGNWDLAHDNLDGALTHYRRVLDYRPDEGQAYFDIAYIYHRRQQVEKALDYYRRGLAQLDKKRSRGAAPPPGVGRVHVNVAQLLTFEGQHAAAIEHYRRAIELEPGLREAYLGLAGLLLREGKTGQAAETYRAAIEHLPADAEVHERLARLYATAIDGRFRNGTAAVKLARRACQLSGNRDPRGLDTLAAAYAEAGDFAAAQKTAGEALRLIRSPTYTGKVDAALTEVISRHILEFQRRRPLRENPAQLP